MSSEPDHPVIVGLLAPLIGSLQGELSARVPDIAERASCAVLEAASAATRDALIARLG